ncbi:fibronectin type III domain-containing protein [Treponema primitia]|uniref:fibronectin type III domain-containing protein n=1 Tax=Treponema primitia TaxID=88058 RepID=UPI00398059E8
MFKRRSFFSGAALFVSALLVTALFFTGCPGSSPGPRAPQEPAAPGLTAQDTQIKVDWAEVVEAEQYLVYYASAGDGDTPPTTAATTINAPALTHTITGLTNGNAYNVWLKAKNAAGTSGFSPKATATPVASVVPPAAPAAPTVTPANQSLEVSWIAVANAVSYEVYYAPASDGETPPATATTINAPALTHTITGLTNGTTYNVWLKALNSAGGSGFSPKASGTAALPAPTNVEVFAGDKILAVTWTAVAGATSYDVYYDSTTTQPGTADQTVTNTFADITLTANGTYNVWVKAKVDSITSVASPMASGTAAVLTIPPNILAYHQSELTSYSYNFTADGFEIDNATKTYYQYDDSALSVSFAGTIVKVIEDNSTDGRIIIKITDAGSWFKTVGHYYAVAYKNASSFAVKQSSASSADYTDPINNGLPTLAEAINEYTVEKEYFGYYGDYYFHAASATTLGDLKGKWYYEDYDMYVVIDGTSYIEFMDGEDYDGVYDKGADDDDMLSLKGDIVDHTSTGNASGILYIKSLASDLVTLEKYFAVAWAEWEGNAITFMNPSDPYDTLEAAKAAKNNPANNVQFDSDGFFDYIKQ